MGTRSGGGLWGLRRRSEGGGLEWVTLGWAEWKVLIWADDISKKWFFVCSQRTGGVGMMKVCVSIGTLRSELAQPI